jgi:hypothetical protein
VVSDQVAYNFSDAGAVCGGERSIIVGLVL